MKMRMKVWRCCEGAGGAGNQPTVRVEPLSTSCCFKATCVLLFSCFYELVWKRLVFIFQIYFYIWTVTERLITWHHPRHTGERWRTTLWFYFGKKKSSNDPNVVLMFVVYRMTVSFCVCLLQTGLSSSTTNRTGSHSYLFFHESNIRSKTRLIMI